MGENGDIINYFKKYDLKFNGSGMETSKICMDKFKTYEILKQKCSYLKSAKYLLIHKEDFRSTEDLRIQMGLL